MKMQQNVVFAIPSDEDSTVGMKGNADQIGQLRRLTDSLFEAPKAVGSYFFVSKDYFETIRKSHPGNKDKRFREWAYKFEEFGLYPVTYRKFSSYLKEEDDTNQPGDVILFGTVPQERPQEALRAYQQHKYVVYISTAESKALAFPELSPEGEPMSGIIDLWDLYTRGVVKDEDGEEKEFDKDNVGVHSVLDYLGSPTISFLAINPTQDSLRGIHQEVPYKTLINNLYQPSKNEDASDEGP